MSGKLNMMEILQYAREAYDVYKELQQDGALDKVMEAFNAIHEEMQHPHVHNFIQEIEDKIKQAKEAK